MSNETKKNEVKIFVKKQVSIEAIQYNGLNRPEIEIWMGKKIKSELESETAYLAGVAPPIFSLLIETKEGVMKAFQKDWIIKEPFPTGDRDFYPCKPDIFANTYSPIQEYAAQKSADPVDEDLEFGTECMYCGEVVPGATPKYCCNGIDCGCMGMPIEPICCSKGCYEMLGNQYKTKLTADNLEEAAKEYIDINYMSDLWTSGGSGNDAAIIAFKSGWLANPKQYTASDLEAYEKDLLERAADNAKVIHTGQDCPGIVDRYSITSTDINPKNILS